jgi:hypothetical protein
VKKDNGIMFVQMTIDDFLEHKSEIEKEQELKKRKEKYGNNVCPLCGGALVKRNGCQICINCGYEKCDI